MNRRYLLLFASVLIAIVSLTGPPSAGTQELDIKTFARQTFIHGVPFEQAGEFGSEDVPFLLEMLEDEQEKPYWPNVVVILGIIGSDQAVDALISFFNAGPSGLLSPTHYAAKTGALMSLGYAVNKTGNLSALTFLIEGVRPGIWVEKNLLWQSPHHPGETERNQDLTSAAVIGLTLSGHAQAGEVLASLLLLTGAGAPPRALVTEALAAHAIIVQDGLAVYYRNNLH